MNTHNDQAFQEQLAAYALGALDFDEVVQVEAQLAESSKARAELGALREVVGLLPYAVPSVEPPARARKQLFARIAADQEDSSDQPVRSKPTPPAFTRSRIAAMVAFAAMLLMIFGLSGITLSLRNSVDSLARTNRQLTEDIAQMQITLADAQTALVDTQTQQQRLAEQLDQSQAQLDQVSQQLMQEQEVFTFISAPGVATRQLTATDVIAQAQQAQGEMYMYPGHSEAVVLFRGLTPLESGQVYRFWLADGEKQIAAGNVTVDADGLARLVVHAPQEVNAFNVVMLTIEPEDSDPTRPSDQVVLEGSL